MATGFSLENVSKRRGDTHVLQDVTFSVPGGELMVLSGPSGSGKTTLLRLIAGLESPDSGRVLIDGEEVSADGTQRVPPWRRSVTMVFQDVGLWPNLSALQNVSLGMSRLRLPRKERIQRAREALKQCGIARFEHKLPGQLSGGELQRVALARALAPRPRFLLLDEPFVFLDLIVKQELFEQFWDLRRAYGFTAVLVTHDASDAIAIRADRVAILEDSTICEVLARNDLVVGSPASRTLRAWKRFGGFAQ